MKYVIIVFLFIFQWTIAVHAQNKFDVKKHNSNTYYKPAISGTRINCSIAKIQGNSAPKSTLQRLEKIRNFSSLNSNPNENSQIIRSQKTGLPIFIYTSPIRSVQFRAPVQNNTLFEVSSFLDEIASLLELENASKQFVVLKTETDPMGGEMVRLQQTFQGKPIEGCESIIHINKSRISTSWNGSYIKPSQIKNPTFIVQESTAIQTAQIDLQKGVPIIDMSAEEKLFLGYSAPLIKSVFYLDEKITTTCIPAYIIEIRPNFVDWWEYVIDANTGNILSAHSKTCHIDGGRTSTGKDLNGTTQTIQTYQKTNLFYTIDASRAMYKAAQSSLPDKPVGAIQTLNLNNTWGRNTKFSTISSSTNLFDEKTISAHTVASKSYEYYQQKHNRNSIDGKGGTIISFINVANSDDGSPMDNAYWNGVAMYYGNGNIDFKPLAGGLDVGGHEMTHGVIQNAANLNYQGESGALNESFADIFGCSIDPEDWQIGEDIVLLSQYPSGALRDLSDPHNGASDIRSNAWQPSHVSEKYTGLLDNGGVHINSGIPNHAYYLFAQATQRSTAEQIFYRALTMYLTRSSQFIDLRIACIAAATDLFTANSNEVQQIKIAFDAVGIIDKSGTPVQITTNEYPINPGNEYLLAYNVNTSLSKKLFRISTSTTQQKTISTLPVFSKPSITDDGSEVFYINKKNQIAHLFLNTTYPQEQILEDEELWNSVAISKDGNRLAATTIENDTSIYVYDFIKEQWATFVLYSPTFTEGIKSGGPIYADALEWNHTGEYLVYDCYNEFKNNSGENISYWDINFIDVWNNKDSDFADGTITKLFPALENGISLGNPTFSKNSSSVIAFDYVDEIELTAYVLGCNIERNEVSPIVQTNELGFPSFNKTDTKLAYIYNSGYTTNTKSIYTVDLDADKISPLINGKKKIISGASTWPIYYADGHRNLPTSTRPAASQNNQFILYPNPSTENNVHIQFTSSIDKIGNIIFTNTLGEEIYTEQIFIQSGDNMYELTLPLNVRAGYYIVTLKSDQKKWMSRFIKL